MERPVRSAEERELDRRRDAAARRELVEADRRRGPTDNLEEAVRLVEAAEEMRRATPSR